MTAKMPKIVVPEQPVWGDNGLSPVSSQKKTEIIDEKSYWILGGGIILFVVALVVIFVSSIVCW